MGKTLFTATHTCTRSIINDPNEKKDEPVDKYKVTENVEAIIQAMKDAKFKITELARLEITPNNGHQ